MKSSNLAWRIEAEEPDTAATVPEAPAPEEWTPENGLVTAVQKIQRRAISAKYKEEIEVRDSARVVLLRLTDFLFSIRRRTRHDFETHGLDLSRPFHSLFRPRLHPLHQPGHRYDSCHLLRPYQAE